MVATTTLPAGKAGTPLTVVAPDAPPFGTRAPGSSGRAAVVVLHERQGVTDQLLARARSLAEHGFLAVVPHLFHRSGEPTGQPGDAAAGEAWQSRLNGADLAVDLGAAVDQARELDAETVGVLGFCLGGSVALWAAARRDVVAAVTFYGGGIATPRWPGVPSGLECARALTVPWLGLYGDDDTGIPSAEVEELRTVLADRAVPTEIRRYPAAGHGFATDPSSTQQAAAAAADGWARAITWFEAHLDATPDLPGPGRPVG